MSDFDESDILVEDGFADVPNAPHEEGNSYKESEKNEKITVEIGNVQKLTADLAYSAQQIENAADKIGSNSDLRQILNFLSDLESPDFENEIMKINEIIKKSVEKVDTTQIETKLQKQLETNLSNISNSAKKLKKYAETFDDQEILNVFDQIDKFEKFLNNFKFRSIVFASLFTVFISLFASSAIGYQLLNYRVEQKFKEISNPVLYFFKGIKQGDILIAEGDGVVQLQILTSNIKVLTASDGTQYLERVK